MKEFIYFLLSSSIPSIVNQLRCSLFMYLYLSQINKSCRYLIIFLSLVLISKQNRIKRKNSLLPERMSSSPPTDKARFFILKNIEISSVTSYTVGYHLLLS